LDYIAEGRHAEQFAVNFTGSPRVDLPRVYWDRTTVRVLTLERIEGIKINQYAQLSAAAVDRSEVARMVFKAYLKQVFEDGFFHADPHPGNLFIRPLPDKTWQRRGIPFDLVFLDFGAVGHISDHSRTLMRRMVIATVRRNYPELVRLAKELGFLLPDADTRALAVAIETLFDRFYGLTMAELTAIELEEVEQLARQFRDLLYQFPFQIPQDFIWLGRTLAILSGIATGLDPDFNPIEELQPFARRLIGAEAGSLLNEYARDASELATLLLTLPRRAERLLLRVEDGDLTREATDPLVEGMAGIEGAINRLTDTMLMMALSAGWYVSRKEEPPLSRSAPLMLVGMLWALWRIVRGTR
jgi:predicted unusual protein kinase regulating ubiquinone biosynthesis (AarF/ABC1/UbiB family)